MSVFKSSYSVFANRSRSSSDYLLRLLLLIATLRLRQIILLVNNANLQTTARAYSNVLAIAKVVDVDFEAIATWAWVVVDLERFVEGHVLMKRDAMLVIWFKGGGGRTWEVAYFDLDLVVDVVCHFDD